jgi:hypothetical protein
MNYELIDTLVRRIKYYTERIQNIAWLPYGSRKDHDTVIYSMCIERLSKRLKNALNETHD